MKGRSQFRRPILRGVVLLLLLACTPAFPEEPVRDGDGDVEMRIPSLNVQEKTLNKQEVPDHNGPYMVLSCRGSKFNISVDWREPVGQPGERRRHLLYHVGGDSHLMLPVLDRGGRSTGYVNQPAKAKALVHEIVTTLQRDFIPIGVFPAGRDPVTGKWIDAWFPANAFRAAVLTVGKACRFDPTRAAPYAHNIDKVPPARPGRQ